MRTATLAIAVLSPSAMCLFPAVGVPPSAAADGKAIYEKANCVGCHKWHGGGGGGYGGAALSLRATRLDRDQLIEVVRCGRPGTRMPFHDKNAWSSGGCYGIDPKTLGNDMPPAAPELLTPEETASVVDFVIAHQKGKGRPNRADCIAFWGEGSRECQGYSQ
jgi:mono/diheme cytochrome c family protein